MSDTREALLDALGQAIWEANAAALPDTTYWHNQMRDRAADLVTTRSWANVCAALAASQEAAPVADVRTISGEAGNRPPPPPPPDTTAGRAAPVAAGADAREAAIMRLTSADNPRSRQHNEDSPNRRQMWRCVPISDIAWMREAAIRGTEASETPPPGLDVERLARALHDGGIACAYGDEPHSHHLDAEEIVAQLAADREPRT